MARQDDAGLVSGPGAARWSFRAPDAVAAAGTRIWVADQGASAVYELNARTGALIRIISSPRYRVGDPQSVAVDGGHVWVASAGYPGPGGSVTEISAATGGLIRVVSGGRAQPTRR